MTNAPSTDLLDMTGVCKKLGKSKPFVYKAMQEMGLPAIRMGARWVFSNASVDAWISSLPSINKAS